MTELKLGIVLKVKYSIGSYLRLTKGKKWLDFWKAIPMLSGLVFLVQKRDISESEWVGHA